MEIIHDALPEARREAVGAAHEVEPLRLREVLRRQRGARPASHDGAVLPAAAASATSSSSTTVGLRPRRQRVVELPQLPAAPPPRRRPLLLFLLLATAARRHGGLARLDGAVVVPLRPHQRPLARAQAPEGGVRPPRALRHRLQRLLHRHGLTALRRRRRHGVRPCSQVQLPTHLAATVRC